MTSLLPDTPKEASVAFRQRKFPYDDDATFAIYRRVYETIEDALRRAVFQLEEHHDLFPQYAQALRDPNTRITDTRDVVYAMLTRTVELCQSNLLVQTSVATYKVAHGKIEPVGLDRVLREVALHADAMVTQARYSVQGIASEYDAIDMSHQRLSELAQFLGTMAKLISGQPRILETGLFGTNDAKQEATTS